jgi:hypothetical protein
MSSQEARVSGDKAARRVRSWLPSAISAMALLGSALSLWESTLKQAEIKLYVSDNIYFTRDPYGSYEVLIVPVTLANRGARDGAVLSLVLDVKNSTNGKSKRFKSTYMAEAQYFGGRDDVSANVRRPKLPFAPLSVAGRGAFTGTLLFYPADDPEQKVIDPNSKIQMTLTVGVLSGSSLLDRFITPSPPPPVTIDTELPDYRVGILLGGWIMPLKVKFDIASTAAAQPQDQLPPPSPTPAGRS